MTTLYKPVLIETAEQAEALPIGTVTLPPARHSGRAVATVKCDDGFWRETGEAQPFTDPEMLDEIALVPIEAEEETSVVVNTSGSRDIDSRPYSEAIMDSNGNVWFGEGHRRVDVTEQFNAWAKQHTRTRFVTPWEEVSDKP